MPQVVETDRGKASILGHETRHVVARHSAEQIAKAQLTEGLTGAAVIAACDPNNPNDCVATSQMAAIVGQLIGMKYSRADETEADWLGVCFMNDSGYDPQDMVKVMQILDSLSQGQSPPNSSAPTLIPATASSRSRQISKTWISARREAPLGSLREP